MKYNFQADINQPSINFVYLLLSTNLLPPTNSAPTSTTPVTSVPTTQTDTTSHHPEATNQWLYRPSIHFGLWNSRSLANKLSFFQALMYSKSFDIFSITETWFSPHIFDCEILVAVSNRIPSKRVLINTTAELI